MVEYSLAKAEVEGSSPFFRSSWYVPARLCFRTSDCAYRQTGGRRHRGGRRRAAAPEAAGRPRPSGLDTSRQASFRLVGLYHARGRARGEQSEKSKLAFDRSLLQGRATTTFMAKLSGEEEGERYE
uniref:Uncharacterized protein ORF125_2 n=1 Tax=Phaeoceros laevis TaxID=37308 RepID=D3J0L1_9EMBR|nr:hypothetical protein PhlaMp46 [Phaeoceros laevis]ACT75325.1 hypothetical protein PhlaMp46 [Phaeoceros laevis]